MRLPIDAYALSDEGIALVARAGAKLTQDCMKGFSLRYEPPEVPQDAAATENRRYGISDASLAARYGYHLAPHPDTALAYRLTAAQSMVLSGEKENVERAHTYNGKKIPEHGCAGQAAYQTRARYRAEDAAAVASDIDTRSRCSGTEVTSFARSFRAEVAHRARCGPSPPTRGREPFTRSSRRRGHHHDLHPDGSLGRTFG